jgi:hypothetical protein
MNPLPFFMVVWSDVVVHNHKGITEAEAERPVDHSPPLQLGSLCE